MIFFVAADGHVLPRKIIRSFAVRFRRQLERIQRAMDRCNVLPPSPGKIEERVKINVMYL